MEINKLIGQNRKISLVEDRGNLVSGKRYAELTDGVLRWRYTIGAGSPVRFEDYDKEWEIYHDKKEVRPENRDEYWQYNATKVGYVYNEEINKLVTARGNMVSADVIHGENGWKLLYSPDKEVMARIKEVEDDSIERVVIEDVVWDRQGGSYLLPISDKWPTTTNFPKLPPMRMILEIPRDQK